SPCCKKARGPSEELGYEGCLIRRFPTFGGNLYHSRSKLGFEVEILFLHNLPPRASFERVSSNRARPQFSRSDAVLVLESHISSPPVLGPRARGMIKFFPSPLNTFKHITERCPLPHPRTRSTRAAAREICGCNVADAAATGSCPAATMDILSSPSSSPSTPRARASSPAGAPPRP